MDYQSWSVVFGEQPSAAKWNILGTNDASFNDGTGIANSVITANKLATGALGSSLIGASTTTSTSYTSTLADGLTLTITATVGSNGLLLVGINATFASSVPNPVNMSYAFSGANTLASNDNRAISTPGAGFFTLGYSLLHSGLTPGATVITAQYSTVTSGTATYNNRRLWAVPL